MVWCGRYCKDICLNFAVRYCTLFGLIKITFFDNKRSQSFIISSLINYIFMIVQVLLSILVVIDACYIFLIIKREHIQAHFVVVARSIMYISLFISLPIVFWLLYKYPLNKFLKSFHKRVSAISCQKQSSVFECKNFSNWLSVGLMTCTNLYFLINYLNVQSHHDQKFVSRIVANFYNHYFAAVMTNLAFLYYAVIRHTSLLTEDQRSILSSLQVKSRRNSLTYDTKLPNIKLHIGTRIELNSPMDRIRFLKQMKRVTVLFRKLIKFITDYFTPLISTIFIMDVCYLITNIIVLFTTQISAKYIFTSYGDNLLRVILVLHSCDSFNKQTEDLVENLKMVSFKLNSQEEREHVKDLCSILENLPRSNFLGYFTIGRTALIPILSNFGTYLVIGLQFHLSMPELSKGHAH
ncbi:UNVERIFIED_CONTAM: hypothetical protein RMT77_001033 [Armadillidium vulgare]